eukprot:9451794-Lingulodinium_polyedra.AAC.1
MDCSDRIAVGPATCPAGVWRLPRRANAKVLAAGSWAPRDTSAMRLSRFCARGVEPWFLRPFA